MKRVRLPRVRRDQDPGMDLGPRSGAAPHGGGHRVPVQAGAVAGDPGKVLLVLCACAQWAIGLMIAAASAAAFAESYRGLFDWAAGHGYAGIWADMFPLMIDVFIGVGELALFIGMIRQWANRTRAEAWSASLLGLAASVAGNVGHVASGDLATHLSAAVPPVSAFAALWVGMGVLKRVVGYSGPSRGSFVAPAGPRDETPPEVPARPDPVLAAMEDVTAMLRDLTGRNMPGAVTSGERDETPPALPSGINPEVTAWARAAIDAGLHDFDAAGDVTEGDPGADDETVSPSGDETPGGLDETPECEICGVPVGRAETGRPAKYCSRSCRDRAYRIRQQDGDGDGPDGPHADALAAVRAAVKAGAPLGEAPGQWAALNTPEKVRDRVLGQAGGTSTEGTPA